MKRIVSVLVCMSACNFALAEQHVNHVTTKLPDGVPENPVTVPEILALAWQQPEERSRLWRPDGTLLSEVDERALLGEFERILTHRVQAGYEDKVSRILLVFFDTGTDLPAGSTGVHAEGEFLSKQIRSLGTWRIRQAGKVSPDRFFSISAVTISFLSIHKLEWPDTVDLSGIYPIEVPDLLQTIERFPEAPVQIAHDVTWTAKPEQESLRGIFKSLRPEGDQLTKYFVRLFGKSGQIQSEYSTLEGGFDDGPLFDIDASKQFAREEFDHLDCYRLRFAKSIYEDVNIRNDIWEE